MTKKMQQIAKSKMTANEKLQQVFANPFLANQELKEQFGSVKGCLVGNIALELSGQDERIRTYLTHVFQSWAAAIEPIVQELATLQGHDDLDTNQIARSIIAYLQGAILMAKVSNSPETIQDLAKSAAKLVC